jgi:Nuclear transport factor 2 (NTF2) domain
MDFNTVGNQFLSAYYNKFDKERSKLGSLYRDVSMLSFEGEQYKGVESILQKYSSFGNVSY